MDKETEKSLLIKEFMSFDFMNDDIDSFISRIEECIINNADDKLVCIVSILKTFKCEYGEHGFQECCTLALPVFTWLESIADWEELELNMLSCIIGYHPSFHKTLDIFDKALKLFDIEGRMSIPKFREICATLHLNLTARVLRARFIDTDVPLELLEATFERSYKFLMPVFISKNFPQRYQLEMRRGLLENNVPMITNALNALEKTGNKNRYHAAKGTLVEYLYYVKSELDTPLQKIVFGHNLRKYRKLIKMSSSQLAELLDVPQNTITGIERGDEGVSLKRASYIAQILEVQVDYLLGNKTAAPAIQDPFIIDMKARMATASEEDKKMILDLTDAYLNNRYPKK